MGKKFIKTYRADCDDVGARNPQAVSVDQIKSFHIGTCKLRNAKTRSDGYGYTVEALVGNKSVVIESDFETFKSALAYIDNLITEINGGD